MAGDVEESFILDFTIIVFRDVVTITQVKSRIDKWRNVVDVYGTDCYPPIMPILTHPSWLRLRYLRECCAHPGTSIMATPDVSTAVLVLFGAPPRTVV